AAREPTPLTQPGEALRDQAVRVKRRSSDKLCNRNLDRMVELRREEESTADISQAALIAMAASLDHLRERLTAGTGAGLADRAVAALPQEAEGRLSKRSSAGAIELLADVDNAVRRGEVPPGRRSPRSSPVGDVPGGAVDGSTCSIAVSALVPLSRRWRSLQRQKRCLMSLLAVSEARAAKLDSQTGQQQLHQRWRRLYRFRSAVLAVIAARRLRRLISVCHQSRDSPDLVDALAGRIGANNDVVDFDAEQQSNNARLTAWLSSASLASAARAAHAELSRKSQHRLDLRSLPDKLPAGRASLSGCTAAPWRSVVACRWLSRRGTGVAELAQAEAEASASPRDRPLEEHRALAAQLASSARSRTLPRPPISRPDAAGSSRWLARTPIETGHWPKRSRLSGSRGDRVEATDGRERMLTERPPPGVRTGSLRPAPCRGKSRSEAARLRRRHLPAGRSSRCDGAIDTGASAAPATSRQLLPRPASAAVALFWLAANEPWPASGALLAGRSVEQPKRRNRWLAHRKMLVQLRRTAASATTASTASGTAKIWKCRFAAESIASEQLRTSWTCPACPAASQSSSVNGELEQLQRLLDLPMDDLHELNKFAPRLTLSALTTASTFTPGLATAGTATLCCCLATPQRLRRHHRRDAPPPPTPPPPPMPQKGVKFSSIATAPFCPSSASAAATAAAAAVIWFDQPMSVTMNRNRRCHCREKCPEVARDRIDSDYHLLDRRRSNRRLQHRAASRHLRRRHLPPQPESPSPPQAPASIRLFHVFSFVSIKVGASGTPRGCSHPGNLPDLRSPAALSDTLCAPSGDSALPDDLARPLPAVRGCDLCGRDFPSADALLRHRRRAPVCSVAATCPVCLHKF
uniref:C2H2-type domain-containing protein n=1 Tax=Macrostomum lignano TaxID=282301 RepID=A0A1I8FII9_9PLAT